MSRKRDIRALWQYILLVQIVSIGMVLFGIVAIGLFLDPTFLGGTSKNTDPVWLWVGIGFIALAIFFIVVSFKQHRRLLWILRNVQPQTMRLVMRSERTSDGTNYTAILDDEWGVRIYQPSWSVNQLQEVSTNAQVYFDPKKQRPAIIKTQQGLLWAMAGRSAYRL
jgi:heme exporter protein D